MSKLKTNTIRHVDGSNDNITLDSSQNVTVEGNATIDGTSTLTGNVTCSGQLKADALRHTGASSDAVTLASDGTCTAKITNNLSNRNLLINGGMTIAQRGTSSTTSGMQTVDRYKFGFAGHDEALTQAQHALTSSDTGPWEKGFRNSYHITNGNQTGGATTVDYAYLAYEIEAQDIANSGWDYTNTSSYLTLSYWVKSSVAQTFYGYIVTVDGTVQSFSVSTGALSANTWKKVTVKIPGHANLQFDDNTASGLTLNFIWPWSGTNRTTSGHTLNAWQTYDSANRMPDNTSTWWTTNDATLEVTGVQLEVGDVATDFEHRSYADELARCQRYLYILDFGADSNFITLARFNNGTGVPYGPIMFPVQMRGTPSFSYSGASRDTTGYVGTPSLQGASKGMATIKGSISFGENNIGYMRSDVDILKLLFDAEL